MGQSLALARFLAPSTFVGNEVLDEGESGFPLPRLLPHAVECSTVPKCFGSLHDVAVVGDVATMPWVWMKRKWETWLGESKKGPKHPKWFLRLLPRRNEVQHEDWALTRAQFVVDDADVEATIRLSTQQTTRFLLSLLFSLLERRVWKSKGSLLDDDEDRDDLCRPLPRPLRLRLSLLQQSE